MDRHNTLWFMFWVWSALPPDSYRETSISSLTVTEFLVKHETKVIAEPPYSPDLHLCDFFLFPKLKYSLRRMRHQWIEAIKRNSLKALKSIPAETYKKCMKIGLTVGMLLFAQKEPNLLAIIKICTKIHKNVVFFNQSGKNLIRWYISFLEYKESPTHG